MQAIYSELAADRDRTALIVDHVVGAAVTGCRSLVLTNRRDHLEALAGGIASYTEVPVLALHGRLSVAERRALRDRVASLDAAREPFVHVRRRRVVSKEGFTIVTESG